MDRPLCRLACKLKRTVSAGADIATSLSELHIFSPQPLDRSSTSPWQAPVKRFSPLPLSLSLSQLLSSAERGRQSRRLTRSGVLNSAQADQQPEASRTNSVRVFQLQLALLHIAMTLLCNLQLKPAKSPVKLCVSVAQ